MGCTACGLKHIAPRIIQAPGIYTTRRDTAQLHIAPGINTSTRGHIAFSTVRIANFCKSVLLVLVSGWKSPNLSDVLYCTQWHLYLYLYLYCTTNNSKEEVYHEMSDYLGRRCHTSHHSRRPLSVSAFCIFAFSLFLHLQFLISIFLMSYFWLPWLTLSYFSPVITVSVFAFCLFNLAIYQLGRKIHLIYSDISHTQIYLILWYIWYSHKHIWPDQQCSHLELKRWD